MYNRHETVVLYIYNFTATNPTPEDQELYKSLGLHLRHQDGHKFYYIKDFLTNTQAKAISDKGNGKLVATSFQRQKMEPREPTKEELLEMEALEKSISDDSDMLELDKLIFGSKKVPR